MRTTTGRNRIFLQSITVVFSQTQSAKCRHCWSEMQLLEMKRHGCHDRMMDVFAGNAMWKMAGSMIIDVQIQRKLEECNNQEESEEKAHEAILGRYSACL